MELSHILDQSQPRVSRHLKLLVEAGLAERFPDGAWVFYRLTGEAKPRAAVQALLALVDPDDSALARDAERLTEVQAARSDEAAAYFARNAARWDEMRSLYVDEADVEAALLQAAGPGPFQRLIDLGSGSGRMLALFGPVPEATHRAYAEARPPAEGWRDRVGLFQLVPLLVHTVLFGSAYRSQVQAVIARLV